MLVRIEMDTVDPARRRDTACIEEVTAKKRADLAIRIGESRTPVFRPGKLLRDGSLWGKDRRWAHDEHRRDGHARLDRRSSDFVNERSNTLSRRPGIVIRMRELKIIGSQHQDHKGERRMH